MSFLNSIRFHFVPTRVRRAAAAIANGERLNIVREVFALDANEETAAVMWADAIASARA